MFGTGLLGGAAAVAAGLSFGTIAMFPMIILSLVLYEIGHARMSDKLGDPTARLQNRASFNPLHWKTHIDPIWTLLVPAITFLTMGMIFGGARPVPVETRYFKNPVKDMASCLGRRPSTWAWPRRARCRHRRVGRGPGVGVVRDARHVRAPERPARGVQPDPSASFDEAICSRPSFLSR